MVDIRALEEADVADWARALNTGFLRSPVSTEEQLADRRASIDLSRTLGAFDQGRCVATFRSFAQKLTAVGGAEVPADAVTNVTVSPTHRRRGLLSRMMTQDLDAAKERGDVVATLIAAEYPIYGRFGFGPATWTTQWEIDVPRAGLDPRWSGPGDGGRIDLVDAADVRKLGPELHERLRRRQPGAVDRSERWWKVSTGVLADPFHGRSDPHYAVYRSAAGEVEGLVSYEPVADWSDNKLPQNTAKVRGLDAVTPAAERALWHYVASIDWILKVRTSHRAPDSLIPLYFPDPRAARVITQADFLWVRILDVVRAMEARTYNGAGSLVLQIEDPAGYTGGRYRLEAGPQGATCEPTTESAELSMDVRELATLWLGDESAVRLADLGTVTEERPGAAAAADALLRTSRRPWCPDMF
ncbi:GNAT family N-acetyltransferase [Streptomyces sp. TRM66268-LWL]|uniref:GNAT family N-acetyltransferase n=1 Tax=Streptomyces polyasparticus TaxID=2767826 RepID=A0ABR7SMD6_9ACTN|nr:GNAT family N-acetyltransferase [Streptomyces polyasparticus]MBC9716641.1 GNAT family N-acetyltransferase [Streptomyces polyasparticus]